MKLDYECKAILVLHFFIFSVFESKTSYPRTRKSVKYAATKGIFGKLHKGFNVVWIQREIQLAAFPKGCHPISQHISKALPELAKINIGLLHIFIKHTSASLTINENADPDVLTDLDRVMDTLAAEDFPYRHQEEGSDDMPAHVKSSLFGCSLTVPIHNGRLVLGTWQGICLCEHRRRASGRKIVLTLQGEE
jgi:secondary thiamine-phosphate synthase enzyme